VSLHVAAGEVVCLMGANGSGKSSLLNTVSGLVLPVQGSVRFNGEDVTRIPTYQRLGRGLAHVLERRRLFPYMTVQENLLLGAYLPALRPARAAALERVFAMFPVLRGRRRQLAYTLSGGEQQMVAIGRALMSAPRFIMLDEPFLGLSPRLVLEVSETLQRINADGVTVLFTEQAIQQSLAISHRGYILESGRLALAGTREALLANDLLQRVYMGLEDAAAAEPR
jgi:branched-chain amino acid transport system ATP-binding protein